MTEQILQTTLVPGTSIDDPYWLHMEIKKDALQDGMTVAEAANLIDAIYNIKSCEPAETQQNDIWQQEDSDTSGDIWTDVTGTGSVDADTLAAQQRFADAMAYRGYTGNCGSDKNLADLLAYNVTIKIFRSHQNELYKLQMANGIASTAVKNSGRVVHTVNIEGKNSHTFDNPLVAKPGVKPPVLSWLGIAGPKIQIKGNTAWWDGEIDGVLRAEFYTEWDEVTITVTGDSSDSEIITGTDMSIFGTGFYSGTESGEEIDDYQEVQCSVLAFYHLQYEELILNRPEEDESTSETEKANICHFVTIVVAGERDAGAADQEARCRQNINETVICQCSGREEFNSYYAVVPCPAGVRDGSTLQGSQERRTYKDCGYRDEANDPALYEEKCCESWPFDFGMPQCKKVVKKFTGTNDKAFSESDYPAGTKFVTVGPVDGQCGEHTIEQVIHAAQCCDGVPEIVWDYDSSIETITPNSSGQVYITGGKSPYEWSIRGSGFSFSGGLRDAVTTEQFITIRTDENACGPAAIYVTDNCSFASEYVRSTNGVWRQVGVAASGPYDYPDVIAQNPWPCTCNLFAYYRDRYDIIRGSRALTYGNHIPDPSIPRATYYTQNWTGCFDEAPAITAGHPADPSFKVTVFDQPGIGCVTYGINAQSIIWQFGC